jgi:endonuclease YncB( thermonuclease family)
MRHKGWLGVVAAAVIVGSCSTGGEQPQLGRTAEPVSTTTRAPVTTTVAAPTPTAPPQPVGEQVTLARVIDGDTLELKDGRRVRVLGIDSCEMNTYGGKAAKSTAELLVGNAKVTLTAQPGVDLDRYKRLLRYVQVDGYDFGVEMVKNDHTGVYAGKNDASREYLAKLYAADLDYALNPPSGRECKDPYPVVRKGDESYSGGDDSGNMPDGALTGGYCRKKWWC